MEKEIVYTDKYALILSDEPIRHNKYGFHIINRTISKIVTFNGYDWKDIIGHLPLSDAPILEGVPLLPPLPPRPTHFECEMVEYVRDMPNIHSKYYLPKTITNSQGQVELVGKYLNL